MNGTNRNLTYEYAAEFMFHQLYSPRCHAKIWRTISILYPVEGKEIPDDFEVIE